jgi:hypothetical protein
MEIAFLLRGKSIANTENPRSRPMGLLPVTDLCETATTNRYSHSTEDTIRRSDPMEGNASHQGPTPRGRRYGGSMRGLEGDLVRSTCVMLGTAYRLRAGEPSSLYAHVAPLLKASASGQRSRCICFSPRFCSLLDSSFLSQLRGKAVSKDPPRPRRMGRTIVQHVLCFRSSQVLPGPPESPPHVDHHQHQANCVPHRPPTTTEHHHLQNGRFHVPIPKTPLRGIGLCNGHDTNFPYKWTSSTYSRHQQFWLYSSVMRQSCSPCNWVEGKINAAPLPLSDTAKSQGQSSLDLLSFPEPAANSRLPLLIPNFQWYLHNLLM